MDNKTAQVLEKCLSNPDVLSKILQHFSDAELVGELSFVNKLWNYEARSVLRKRGDLVAHLKHNCKSSLTNVTVFLRDLQQMNVAPFGGVCFDLQCVAVSHVGLFTYADVDPTLEVIRKRLTLKQISIKVDYGYRMHKDCPGLLLINKVVHHFSQNLEILSVDVAHPLIENLLLKTIPHCNFPRLKMFKLGNQCTFFPNLMKLMVASAPNLQEITCFDLYSHEDINPLAKTFQGSSSMIVYKNEVTADFREIPDSLIGVVKVEDVKLCYTGPAFDLDRFNIIAPILLRASTTTLRAVEIDVVLAVPLMCYGVCLKNVKQLVMRMDYTQLELVEPRLLGIVKNFDFTQIFPTLDKVQFVYETEFDQICPDQLSRILEVAGAILGEPRPHRAMNIKHLHLDLEDALLSDVTVQFFAEMFPNVTQIRHST